MCPANDDGQHPPLQQTPSAGEHAKIPTRLSPGQHVESDGMQKGRWNGLSQGFVPAGQPLHWPLSHWPLLQTLPHAPQLLASVRRSVQSMSHSVSPAGHWQAPF